MADTNWIATAAPVVHANAKPVFVDILEDTWCIDPVKVEKAITNKTKAIIATHLYGNFCDIEALKIIGEKYSIPIIEDSAEAIGSEFKKKKAGTFGKFSTFSFHGTKTLTTGEGGMFVTNDTELYEQVVTLNNHGRSNNQKKQFWADVAGFKFKMSNVQAAIGCAQMNRINNLIGKKREILDFYRNKLSKYPFIKINPKQKNTINGSWMPTIVFDKKTGITRENFKKNFLKIKLTLECFFGHCLIYQCLKQKKIKFLMISQKGQSICQVTTT